MNDNPNTNSTQSQNKRIYEYLKNGNSITSLEALTLFGCLRLSGRIFDIKEQFNADIHSEFVQVDTGKYVKRYYIPKTAIA